MTSQTRPASRLQSQFGGRAELACHFDRRAESYNAKYGAATARDLYEHEKRARIKITCRMLLDQLPRDESATILDVGCGAGHLICRVLAPRPAWQALGIDLSPQMIDQAREAGRRAGLASRCDWQVRAFARQRGRFSAVVALGVLGYQQNQRLFVDGLARRVAPGGLLVLTYGNARSLLRCGRTVIRRVRQAVRGETNGIRCRAIEPRRVQHVLQQAGLQQVEHHWLAFGTGLGRWAAEARFSHWAERGWQGRWWAKWLAQVGLAVYRRPIE